MAWSGTTSGVASDCETCNNLNDDDIVDSVAFYAGVPGGGGKDICQGNHGAAVQFQLGRDTGWSGELGRWV
jgi:hypothetical protein